MTTNDENAGLNGDRPIDVAVVEQAERLLGLTFTEDERTLMLPQVEAQRRMYTQLRTVFLPNAVPPATHLGPGHLAVGDHGAAASCVGAPEGAATAGSTAADHAARRQDEDLPFLDVATLGKLLRAGEVSSLDLTQMYLERLRQYDPDLHCVVTLTEELALAQAGRADAELRAGYDRGPLHGIPWGAKDLLAVRGYPTTWGAAPYRGQTFDSDATVVQRLEQAGAVLLAKLSLGELAWGDEWFGGKTRSPWDLEQGSSGSSAGSAAATSAGLVGFSIGSETWGSIVSPSTRCGVTGLRPTAGRVSRHGAMTLSWSMDKLGPICRSVEDCALVLAAIHGADERDPTSLTRPFPWPCEVDLARLRIGFVESYFAADYEQVANDRETLRVLQELGAELAPIHLPDYPIEALGCILDVEAAASFDELTRSGRDDELVRQGQESWPNTFRAARLVPAVEYLQAQRVRTLLIAAMSELMQGIDLYLAPSVHGNNLLLTNLTGHPAVVLPNGFTPAGMPTTITLTGRLFDEARLLACARQVQEATGHHLRRPPLAAQAAAGAATAAGALAAAP